MLGIEELGVRRCGVILQTLFCEHETNTNAFNDYAVNTTKLLIDKYAWSYIIASVHKILFDGSIITEHYIVSGRQSSGREAQQLLDKDLKNIVNNNKSRYM